jgi:hypothetical protein
MDWLVFNVLTRKHGSESAILPFQDITPVSGSDLYFGFGGLAVDAQVSGTVMVAALNSWWPEASIYRSLDAGATWSKLWDWASYPTMNYYFGWYAGNSDFALCLVILN